MALVRLVFHDVIGGPQDGTVGMELDANPTFDIRDPASWTGAQQSAMTALQAFLNMEGELTSVEFGKTRYE